MDVICDMDTGTTEVGDEVTGTIDTCDGSGCSEITVAYPGHIDQIKNLIMVSESCSQEISFKCFGSALKINSVYIGWWINANGKLIQRYICRDGFELEFSGSSKPERSYESSEPS